MGLKLFNVNVLLAISAFSDVFEAVSVVQGEVLLVYLF